jgi:hypothetical protein
LKEEFSDAFSEQYRIRVQGGRDITMNCVFNEPDIIKHTRIKINKLSWAGHIRMENSRTVKKVFDTRPEGTRKIGRPEVRWEDGVIQDIRAVGVKTWRNVAMDREDWWKLLKKARVHTGLSSQW